MLSASVPEVDTTVLLLTVSVGVGLFLALCLLRILLNIPLRALLLLSYLLVFLGAIFTPGDMLAVAFDAGGVTTGPMTVPFIMALSVGVAAIRSDANAKADGFGLVALCSVGPILSVMLLSIIYRPAGSAAAETAAAQYDTTLELGLGYWRAFPVYLGEVALALLPIFAFFLLFQLGSMRLRRDPFLRIVLGVAYTYAGLVLFLTGVNVGFSPLGYALDAAREAGAAGGTVLHAKGTGSRGAEKFFGVRLADEKDLVYVVAHKDDKAAIMRAIGEKAGPGTKAGAICFSLPISSVVGLRQREADAEE